MWKIAVADDDSALLMLYAEELKDEGYDVFTAKDSARLMQIVETQQPDVIILEIKLGREDGSKLVSEIKRKQEHTSVILCTAYPLEAERLKSLEIDGYVMKSSDLSDLKAKIRAVAPLSEDRACYLSLRRTRVAPHPEGPESSR